MKLITAKPTICAQQPATAAPPVRESASGGELSRLMLALKVVLARGSPVPTLIFDEVDAGIGGATAIFSLANWALLRGVPGVVLLSAG